MDTCSDIMKSRPHEKDVEEKKRKRLEWQEGPLTKFSNLIESRIQAAGGSSVVEDPSIADFIVMGVVESIKKGSCYEFVDTNFFDRYPGIKYVQNAFHFFSRLLKFSSA
jgi:hypothetical protein